MRRYRHRCDAKLTRPQVRAAYVVYRDQGLSLRGVAALIWERYGYASQASCANSLHDLFVGEGFLLRDREAAYKRWHRETFGPWPSDLKDYSTRVAAASPDDRPWPSWSS